MILYTQTPDYYSDYIEHGWLKDQAAKVHKYIERWRGKNGKWYYRYATQVGNKAKKIGKNLKYKAKSKALDLKTKYNRIKLIRDQGYTLKSAIKGHPEYVTRNYGKEDTWRSDRGTVDTLHNGDYRESEKRRHAQWNVITDQAKNYNRANQKVKEAKEEAKAAKQRAKNNIHNEETKGKVRTQTIKANYRKNARNLTEKGYSNSKGDRKTYRGTASALYENKSTNKNINNRELQSRNRKSLSNQGYADSKKSQKYKKKLDLGLRGYSSSSNMPDRIVNSPHSILDYRVNKQLSGGGSRTSDVWQDISSRYDSAKAQRRAATEKEKKRTRSRTRSRNHNL